MAKMEVKLTTDIRKKLSKLEGQKVDHIAKKAVYSGAGIIADKIRENLKLNLEDSEISTGDLLNSLGISSPLTDRDGGVNSKIGFDGYDRKGVPNALKARAMESGTSTQEKKPFIDPAIKQTRSKVKKTMTTIVEDEIEKVLGGK